MSELGDVLQKINTLDKMHKNVISSILNITIYGGDSDNKAHLLEVETLILKKYEEIISEL